MNAADAYQAFDQPPYDPVAFLAWAVATSGLGGPIRVMDLGCGPGRLLVPMRELGWSVTGLEPNPEYFRAAQDVISARPDIEVRHGGFLDLEDDEAFEVIACINDTFQYLLTPPDRRIALERMLRALVPSGLVVLDLANFLYILHNYRPPQPVTIQFREGELTRTILHTVDFHQARWIHTDEFCYLNGAGRCTQLVTTHTLAIVTFPEVAHSLEEAGFIEVRAYPSLVSRSEGRVEGARMVVTARKP